MDTEYTDTMLTVDTASILDHVIGSESNTPIEQYGGSVGGLELTPMVGSSSNIKTDIDLARFKSNVENAVRKYQSGGRSAPSAKHEIQFNEISEFTELSDVSDY